MEMIITHEINERCLILRLQGRLDAFGSKELDAALEAKNSEQLLCAVVDMAAVNYLSSAGLRVFLKNHKIFSERGGALILTAVQPYCTSVLEISGFAQALSVFPTLEEGLVCYRRLLRANLSKETWKSAESVNTNCGSFRTIALTGGQGAIEVLGDIGSVLHAQITRADLSSKRFFQTEYSIGLGGLGDRTDEYFGIMGEMITIGGTMVWLPTDGHDTPDFLIPKIDTDEVTLRTAFNVSITGGFDELLLFNSSEDQGTSMDGLYKALFEISNARRPDYKGILGLAVRAQMSSVYGSGVKKSPVDSNAPSDGEMITHPAHFAEWFDADTVPRHTNVTGLICGIGADLTRDLSSYDQRLLNLVFYLHPANRGKQSVMLHNHAVIFSELPMSNHPVSLETEISSVVENGDFCDMRHLLDRSALTQAVIGISYIQNFRRDPNGVRMVPR
jgi:anti-anti-sigma factor